MACTSQSLSSVTDAPISILDAETQEISVEVLLNSAQTETEKILPGAYLTFFSFVGHCEDLPQLKGQVMLNFVQESSAVLGTRISIARVSIDTNQQTLNLEAKDETSHYPSTEPLELNGKDVKEIAIILHDYLVSTNRCGGTVVLARAETNGLWGVRCGPPNKVFVECLEIDPLSGETIDPR
jgi:hypothetical protein